MASYQGSPFEAGIGPTDNDIVLFAACPPPEELGFEPATGHWRRQLRIADVQAVWESRPVGLFRGERCMVLDDLGDRLHIGYLGHDGYKAEQLGYWQVDRGVFELVAPRAEVTEILEERTEYPSAGTAGVTAAGHPAAAPGSSHSGQHAVPANFLIQDPAASPTAYPESPGQEFYSEPPPAPQGAHAGASSYPATDLGTTAGSQAPSLYMPLIDDTTGVAVPVTAEAPLPLEAEAMRAASAARRPRQTPAQRRNTAGPVDRPAPASTAASQSVPGFPAGLASQPGSLGEPGGAQAVAEPVGLAPAGPLYGAPLYVVPDPAPGAGSLEPTHRDPAQPGPAQTGPAQPGPAPAHSAAPSRQRRAARRRMATERLFADLASQAGIPPDAYAVGEEVEGAMCLIQTNGGFEVFHSADGARHELQVFATEESACFYLFGVLAAEAVRTGSLARSPAARP